MAPFSFGGSDDEDDLEPIARSLGAEPAHADIERRLDRLEAAVDSLVGTAPLEGHEPAPDSDSVTKLESLERAISREVVDIRPVTNDGSAAAGDQTGEVDGFGRDSRSGSGDITPSERSASTRLGQRLLEVLGPGRVPPETAESTVVDALEAIDEYETFQRELHRAPVDGSIESASALLEAYQETRRSQRRTGDERERLEDTVRTLLAGLDCEPASDESLTAAVRRATRTLDEERRRSDAKTDRVPRAVSRVQATSTPRSRASRSLLAKLHDGDVESVVAALQDATDRLDEHATTKSVVETIDRSAIETMAEELMVQLETDTLEGATIDAVTDRVAELRSRLERADESNVVMAYAVREELTFYRRTFLDALRADASVGSTGTADDEDLHDRLATLESQRSKITSNYVERRSDHNHSIPLYFLSLADTYCEEAEEHLKRGRPGVAEGTLDVTESLLDHVEGLYEKNQYSIMLRSLRG